jgi:hypothetical protein
MIVLVRGVHKERIFHPICREPGEEFAEGCVE